MVQVGRQPQTLEYGARPGFGGVAVIAQEGLLELGEAVGVEVLLRPGKELLLLGLHGPEGGIAHQRHVQYFLVLVDELVLVEDPCPQPLWNGDLAFAGFHAAREDIEKGGLA